MCPKAGVTHDCVLADASAGTPSVGLMLARKNGQRHFGVKDFPTIAPRILTTEELNAAQLPPSVALTWFQEDWSAGLGGINHRLHPKQYALGKKLDASLQGKVELARQLWGATDDIAPTAYKPSGYAVVATEVWSFQERDAYLLTYATNQFVKTATPQAAAVVYRNGVEFGGSTYVPCWVAATDVPGTYIYKTGAGGAWVVSTLAVKTFKYFCRARTEEGTDIFVGANIGAGGPNVVYSTTDPTNAGAWTILSTVGNSDSEITGLVSDGTSVLVLKTNGVWVCRIGADGTAAWTENLTPEFEGMVHADNFRGAFNWNGHLLLPLGTGGMMEWVDGKLYDVSMKKYAPDQTTLHGRVIAIGGDVTRLFLLVEDTANTDCHLLMATWDSYQGVADYRWHHVATIAYTGTPVPNHAALFAEGIPSGATLHHRIWFSVECGSSNLLPYFYPLPDPDDANLGYDINDTSQLVTTLWDANMPGYNKLYSSIDFTTDNLGTTSATDHYIEVKYRVNGGSWAYVTGAQATSTLTADKQTLTFADEISGKTLELQFLFFQGTTTTTTPVLKDFTVNAALRATEIPSYLIQAYLATGQILLNGARGGTPVADLAQLKAWNAAPGEQTLTMPDGTTQDVIFLPGEFRYEEVWHGKHRRPEYICTFVLGAV